MPTSSFFISSPPKRNISYVYEGKVSTEYVAPKQDVQSISVEVTPEMYLLDGVSVLVLITASVLVSGIVILKRNPKDILSEMS